ncbi:MAG: ECF transporter S component, partial [bacterium]
MNKSLKRLTNVGVLTALAVVLMLFSFPYPYAPFLQYEFGDVPLLIIGFLYGPVYGLVSTIIGSIAMAVLTGKGGPYGVIMHVIATGTLVVIASYMYNKWHT